MSYFNPFPTVPYKFGNEETFSRIQNLSAYVDIIDDIKDDVNFYREYTIIDGDRPDNVSQKLYGTPDLHWTLYLLNDNIRERGWPLSNADVRAEAKVLYPNTTAVTYEDISSTHLVGSTVEGVTSTATGTILRRRFDFGQIIISTTDTFIDGELLKVTEGGINYQVQANIIVPQYNSVHNYIAGDQEPVDINPFDSASAALFTPVTYTDKLINQNNELRDIRVIKPSAINSVVSAFTQALRS